MILRRGNGVEPESLDIHSARSEAALTLLRDLYEGLTAMGPDGEPVPAAAESYDRRTGSRTVSIFVTAHGGRTEIRWSLRILPPRGGVWWIRTQAPNTPIC
jgi:ABC-type oligopeptide transport system substrate-binding subunit